MRIYIAGSFDARERLQGIRETLVSRGHIVTSRWLDETAPPELWKKGGSLLAVRDMSDIQVSDLVLFDTLEPSTTGGTDWEMGYARGLQKRALRVGPARNGFHDLLLDVPTWDDALGPRRPYADL